MKKNRFLALLLSVMTLFSVSLLTSCEETEADEGIASLTLSTTSMAFNADGTSSDDTNGELTITANRNWVVSVPAAADWVIVDEDQLMGSGNATIQVSVPDNTGSARSATVSVKLYNDSGLLMEETFTVSQADFEGGTEITASTARFDGSELPTAYSSDEVITVDGSEFTINQVANFTTVYDTATGPIQFKTGVSYIYNNLAFADLTKVVITLSNSYNNFTVYAGTEQNPLSTAVDGTTVDSTVTYTMPEGTTFVTVANLAEYTAYADAIEFLCGDDEAEGGSTSGGDDNGGDDDGYDYVAGQLTIDGSTNSDFPTSSSETDTAYVTGGASFVLNNTYISTYGSVSSTTNGYFYNLTAFEGLTKVVITEDYTYYNYSLYAGTEVNPTSTEISYTKTGNYYVYEIPEGCKYISVINNSTYTAYCDVLDFYFDSLGDTADFDGPTGEGGGSEDDTTGGEGSITEGVTFDGSELPTAYPTDATLTMGDVDFVLNQVANFSASYETTGPIQFKSEVSYLYNTTAFVDLSSIVVTLSNEYNNFTIYAGTEANPTETEITGTTDGSTVTYTMPEGITHAAIYNQASYTAYANVIEFVCGGETSGDDDTGGDDEGYTYEAGQLTIDGSSNLDFPSTASSIDEVVVTSDASFVLNNTYISTYGSVSSYTGGYFYNLTAFEGLTQVVVTEDYTYYNYSLYAGTEVNPTTDEISYTKEGNYYIYDIPEGCKYISVINNSTYTAYGDVVDFYFDSLGDTAEFEGGSTEEEDEPETEDLPTYELTGTILATDFISENGVEAPDAIFGVYQFVWGQGTHASLAPKYYTSGDAIRMYSGNTLTVSTTDGSSITSIDFEFDEGADYLSSDVGTYDATTGGWSGDATSITFTSSATSARIMSITMNGFVGDDANEDDTTEDEGYTYTAGALTIDGSNNADFPTESSDTDAVYATGGASFVLNSTYLSTYGSVTTAKGGYFYNLTAFEGLTQVVITEDYTYYNYSLYAGTEVNPTTDEISYTKEGDYYIYEIPEGCKYITVINNSTYTAYGDVVDFYFDSLGDTAEFEGGSTEEPEEEDEPETEDLPTYELTGTILSTDFISENGVEAPDAIFGVYQFVWGQGTHASLAPKYYTSGDAIRMYSGNTLTVSTTDGSSITSIDFEFAEGADYLSSDVGTYDSTTGGWSGSATSITFTSSATSARIMSITMNGFTGEEGGSTEEPDDDTTTAGTASTARFDGSELPTAYSTDEVITVDGSDFTINQVANYGGTGPIQFKSSVSYLYNNDAFEDLSKVVVTLSNSYNNLTIYAGSEKNPLTTVVEGTTVDSTVTYTMPAGTTYVTIANIATYTGYADNIEFLCGSDESTAGDTTEEDGYTYTAGTLTIDGSSNADFPTASSDTDAVYVTGGASFVLNSTYLSTYGSVTTTKGGYFYNLTAFEGLTQVVVTEDYTYYNYTLYAGTEVNPTADAISYTKEGNYYIYEIPAGCKYITFAAASSYTAYGDVVDFYFDSLGDTADDSNLESLTEGEEY